TVDGHAFHGVPTIISYLQTRKGAPLHVLLGRNGKSSELTLQPRQEPAPDGSSVWRIGFGGVQPPSHVEQMPFVPAMQASLKFNRDNSLLILEILKRLFSH